MQRSTAFPGWCAICRWTAVGAISVGTMAVLGAATSDHRPAPTVVRLAAEPEGTGLDWPGWTVRDPAEQKRSLDLLLSKEKARRAAATRAGAAAVPRPTTTASAAAAAAAAIPRSALGQGTTLAAPQAVSVAIKFALAQVGKPYLWGATGPDAYDCSGLVQRSYLTAGIALPRTSREQARVGTSVDLQDLLPGDLLFWAYDPTDLATVHHVAMYLGDGKIVQAPQPGEFVEVTTLWLSGYAGAVRVATGPATATLPPVPPAVPGTGVTPIGDAMPDGSPPPPVPPSLDTPPRPGTRTATPAPSGTRGTSSETTSPGTTSPGTTSPGTTSPGTTSPGTTSPGTTSPGGTSSDTTSPDTTSPDTTSPDAGSSSTSTPSGSGTSSPSDGASGTTAPSGSQQPSGTDSAPATSAPAPSSTAPSPTEAPSTPAATQAPSSSPAPDTTTASSTPPPPSPSADASTGSADASTGSADASTGSATTTSAAPQPSVSPSSPTPSHT